MKTKTKWWLWLILAALIMGGLGVWYKTKNRPRGTEVTTEKAGLRDITETVSASGKIYPEKEIKISSDVSGEIVDLFVHEGDSVRAGQILARINPDVYQSAVERTTAGVNVARSQARATQINILAARAQRDQVKAQYQNAVRVLERNRKLFQDGVISQADLELSETNARNLEASLNSAEANIEAVSKQSEGSGFSVQDAEALLKEQRTNLGRTIIKAPVSGIISKLSVEKGERVVGTIQMSGTEMMRIADLSVMEVQVEVSENDIVRIQNGNPADIDVDAYQNRRFTGVVTEISNSASNLGSVQLTNDQVTKFIVKVRIDTQSYQNLIQQRRTAPFKPGMSATVEIKTSKAEGVLSVPIQSVTAYNPEDEKKKLNKTEDKEVPKKANDKKVPVASNKFIEAVYVVSGDSVNRRDVETGIQDQDYIHILSGLEQGDEVVTGPYTAISRDLKQGSKIRRKKEKDKK